MTYVAGTLGAGTVDGGVIRKAPAGPVAGRMIAPTNMKLRGLQMQRRYGDTPSVYFSTWDWAGWIKPQIDLAVSVGANALKWFPIALPVKSGAVTRSVFNSHVDQFLDYTDGLGLYTYLTLVDGFTDLLDAGTRAEAVATAAHLTGRTRITGYDMGNEINIMSPTDCVAHVATLRPQLLAVTTVPLSTGLAVGNINTAFADDAKGRSLAPYCDFMDFHAYWASGNLVPADVITWWRIQPHYKPWVMGEVGRAADQTSPNPLERWTSLADLAAMTDCFGCFGYTTQDFEPAPSNFGMFAVDGSGPRTALSVPFATWPAHA